MRFGGGPYADTAAEFLALAVRLTRDGGRVGLVLPLSMLSTRDVAAIRDDVSRLAALRWMWWSPTSMFDAGVRVWAELKEAAGRFARAAGGESVTLLRCALPRVGASGINFRSPLGGVGGVAVK